MGLRLNPKKKKGQDEGLGFNTGTNQPEPPPAQGPTTFTTAGGVQLIGSPNFGAAAPEEARQNQLALIEEERKKAEAFKRRNVNFPGLASLGFQKPKGQDLSFLDRQNKPLG